MVSSKYEIKFWGSFWFKKGAFIPRLGVFKTFSIFQESFYRVGGARSQIFDSETLLKRCLQQIKITSSLVIA